MSSELIGPVSGTSEDDEAGSLRKGGSEIRRKARRNFRVADILNLQIRPAPDRLREQVSRCADICLRKLDGFAYPRHTELVD